MDKDVERDMLNQEFATMLAGYIHLRGTDDVTEREVAASPEHDNHAKALADFMHVSSSVFRYFIPSQDPERPPHAMAWNSVPDEGEPGFLVLMAKVAVGYSLKSKESKGITPNELTEQSEQDVFKGALNYAQKQLKTGGYLDQLRAIMVCGFVAAYHKPEGIFDPLKPKKHKGESPEHRLYRQAMRSLTGYHQKQLGDKNVRTYLEHIRGTSLQNEETFQSLLVELSDPANEALRDGHAKTSLNSIASTMIESLTDKSLVSEDFKLKVLNDYLRNKQLQHGPNYETTKWTILPPGTLEELEQAGTTRANNGENDRYIDPARMKWLASLAISWSPDAYIAVANLGATGNYDYRIAVLPETTESGETIEHAVAENPASGNAIYVFRAEKGFVTSSLEDAHAGSSAVPQLTWREVFDKTKPIARDLGARRVLHGVFAEENVIEYLTRPVDELSKQGYRR